MTAEAERPHVVVIGAGIVGASIAYHLSKHTQVTVIDKGQPGLGSPREPLAGSTPRRRSLANSPPCAIWRLVSITACKTSWARRRSTGAAHCRSVQRPRPPLASSRSTRLACESLSRSSKRHCNRRYLHRRKAQSTRWR
nr:FAD-binding oxidoreductase [Pseudomonas sp. BIGb0427]